MVGRTNTGGGGSGATLTIMGVAGATVAASKNGKTYTRTINNSGTAVFKGLATGTWTVTMSGGGQSTTRTVEITADYSLTIAYFSATITITYPANSTCVVTDSSGATIASDTNTGTAAKTWTATVGATGTYTITATATDASGKTRSTTVSITTDGQVATVELTYELVLFDNGVVDGYAWDSASAHNGYATNDVSTTIHLSSMTYDNGAVLVSPWVERGISAPIDLSNYSVLKARISKVDATAGNAYLWVGSKALGDDIASQTLGSPKAQTYSLDISNINTSRYISVGAHASTGSYGNTVNVYFDKVWLE